MTNAERFIGDEDLIDTFIGEMAEYMFDNLGDYTGTRSSLERTMTDFFKEEAKPTLTEDERVILKNIQKGLLRKGIISRTKTGELLVYIQETGEIIELYIFNHLFQFIKERRRI